MIAKGDIQIETADEPPRKASSVMIEKSAPSRWARRSRSHCDDREFRDQDTRLAAMSEAPTGKQDRGAYREEDARRPRAGQRALLARGGDARFTARHPHGHQLLPRQRRRASQRPRCIGWSTIRAAGRSRATPMRHACSRPSASTPRGCCCRSSSCWRRPASCRRCCRTLRGWCSSASGRTSRACPCRRAGSASSARRDGWSSSRRRSSWAR